MTDPEPTPSVSEEGKGPNVDAALSALAVSIGQHVALRDELVRALEGVVRIVDALRVHTGLGKTQIERLQAARAAIARAKGETK